MNTIINATIELCTGNLEDIVKCLRTKAEVPIFLDMSKKPVATPITDATRNIVRYVLINPMDIMAWEYHQERYNERKQDYKYNKLAVSYITTTSLSLVIRLLTAPDHL